MKNLFISLLTLIVSMAYCFETVEFLLDKIKIDYPAVSGDPSPHEDNPVQESDAQESLDEFVGIESLRFAAFLHVLIRFRGNDKQVLIPVPHSSEVYSPPETC